MMNAHTSLGIAQIVFYVPIVPLAIYLLVRNWVKRPRMAWWPMVPLSLMRLAGGGVIIAFEKHPSVGLYIAAIVLLNVGVIPLIVSNLGQLRIILMDNYGENPNSRKIAVGLRLSFGVATALLAAGGGVDASQPSLGRTLTLVGYIVFTAVLAVLIAMEIYFFTQRATLLPSSRRVLKGLLCGSPFLIVRAAYGILYVSFSNHGTLTKWNPVFGSITAFAVMALLMEYIAICIYLYVGYSMPPDRGVRNEHDIERVGK